jgi:hypothetical protein
MRVETEISIHDYRAFYQTVWAHARRLPPPHAPRWERVFHAFTPVALFLFYFVFFLWRRERVIELVLGGGLLLLAAVFYIWYRYGYAKRRLEPLGSGDILGPRSIELTDEGIVISTRHLHAVVRWAGVLFTKETPDHLFLFTDRCAALIVPKRSFESAAHIEEFKAFAEANTGAPKET